MKKLKQAIDKKLEDRKKRKEYEEKLKELRKRDPFIYKNF